MTIAGDAIPNGAAGARICALILGMHRSGTSALARTLNLLGCDLPKTLVPEAPGNEAGHWESAPICRLNDALLDSAGTNWRDFEPVNPDWFRSPRAAEYRAKAIAALREEFGESFLFVLKDPRMCRIAGWWTETIEAAGAAPAIISIVRHPLEVADSLKKRDNFDVALGELLWLRNTLDAEAQTRGRRRAFVSYDGLLQNWSEAIGRAQNALGLAWPKRQSFVTPAIDQFLSDKLRHHRRATSGGDDGAHAWAAEAFAILDRWAASGENADDYAALDAIRARLDEAGHAFARIVALQWYHQGQASKLETSLADSKRVCADLSKSVAEAEGRARQAAMEGAELSARLAQTKSALRQREAESEEGARQIVGLKSELAASEERCASATQDVAALSAELKARFDELAVLTKLLQEREAALADINQRLIDRDAAGAVPSRLVASHASDAADYQVTITEIGLRLSARERAYAELDAMFAARIDECIELKRAKQDSDAAERARERRHALRDDATAREIACAPLPRFKKERELRRRATLISKSGMFDAAWYASRYKDVAEAGVDPVRHFVEHGAKEGRFANGAAEAALREEGNA